VLRRFATSCLLAIVLAGALPAAARTRPHYGGTLRVEIEGDPWQQPSSIGRRLVFDGLTRIHPDGTVAPALALRWTSENDAHRWQFWLRPGVHFSDGTPLTSITVVTALNTACPSNCPWTAVRALGASVVFTSDSPLPALPALLASNAWLIAIPSSTAGAGGLLGTGPFQPAGFANSVLTLAANEFCWQGRPFLDTIEIRVHRSVRDQWLDLSVGRTDLVEVPADQIRQAQQQRLTVLTSPPITLVALQIRDYGALANPMLRAALAVAIDRSALFNVIFQKQGEVTASLLPSALTGYSFLFPTERDLNKARTLRGGLTPHPLTLSSDTNPAMQLAAQRIALNLREAGFNVQTATGADQADLILRTLSLESSDPQSALESILHAAGQTIPIPDSAPATLYKIESESLRTNTLIPLLYLPRAWAISGRLRDLRLDAAGFPALADSSLEDAP
jgi:peptide/nickel transport system substrate-binding protein